jgi:hypothetical protein
MPVVYLPWRRHLTVRRAERRFPTIPSTIPADAQTRQSSLASDLLHILTSNDMPPVWLSCYPTSTGEHYPLKAEGSGVRAVILWFTDHLSMCQGAVSFRLKRATRQLLSR